MVYEIEATIDRLGAHSEGGAFSADHLARLNAFVDALKLVESRCHGPGSNNDMTDEEIARYRERCLVVYNAKKAEHHKVTA